MFRTHLRTTTSPRAPTWVRRGPCTTRRHRRPCSTSESSAGGARTSSEEVDPAKLSKDGWTWPTESQSQRPSAAGILHCTVKGNRGQRSARRIQGVMLSRLGRDIGSPTSLLKKGLRCVVEVSTPHLTRGERDSTRQQDPARRKACAPSSIHVRAERPAHLVSEVPRAPPVAVTDPHVRFLFFALRFVLPR